MTLKDTKVLYAVIATIILIILVGFVVYRNQEKEPTHEKNTYSYTASSGKKVLVKMEEAGTSSKAIIITEGFENNAPITVEKEVLSDVFFTDLNGDSFEDLVLVFTSKVPGGNGDISAFTTFYDTELTPIELPQVGDEDKMPGMLFEGYMGGDIFLVEENTLFRNFLVEDTAQVDTTEEIGPPEEELVQEEPPLEVGSSSEPVVDEPEAKPATKQKQISYALTSSEGLFYLVPREAGSVKVFTASSTATLANTSWAWLSLNHEDTVTSATTDHPLLFSFNDDNTFFASTSCETFTGNYLLSGYLLRMGSVVTQTITDDALCKKQNQLLREALPLSESLVIRAGQLMVNLEENKGVILFIKQ